MKKGLKSGAIPYEYNGHVVPGMFKAQDGYSFDPSTIGKVPRERMKSQMVMMGNGGSNKRRKRKK
jgi:hypothetical protein